MYDYSKYEADVTAVRLPDGPFVTRSSGFAVTYREQTPLARYPNVAWSLDGDAAMLEAPGNGDDGTVYVDAARGGASVLHAFVGPPLDRQIDLPIFAYRSLLAGCARTPVATGLNFLRDGRASTAEASTGTDLSVRGLSCGTAARQPIGIVAAGGFAFVATPALADFAAVRAGAWHAGGTTIAGFATYGTLLTRLRDGRTLKFFLEPGGKTLVDAPYAIAPRDGEFPDVAFLAREHAATSHRLPDAIRIPAASPRPRATVETIARTGPLRSHPERRLP